ncbi:hypothetical protein DFJ74DRAFT_57708 [Hyaloraphidium curvatum]|nr:hypothetical protein DFJ74DRAFT_57708 [Hyaloraphidium curvatum]
MAREVVDAPRTKGFFMSAFAGVAPIGLASFAISAGWDHYGTPVVLSISLAMITGLVGLSAGILGISATLRPDVFARRGTLAASWTVVVAAALCFAWFVASLAHFTSFRLQDPRGTLVLWDNLSEGEKEYLEQATGCEGRDPCMDALFNYFWYLSRDRVIASCSILFGYVIALGFLIADREEAFPGKD